MRKVIAESTERLSVRADPGNAIRTVLAEPYLEQTVQGVAIAMLSILRVF